MGFFTQEPPCVDLFHQWRTPVTLEMLETLKRTERMRVTLKGIGSTAS
jgi:hypothetical protein